MIATEEDKRITNKIISSKEYLLIPTYRAKLNKMTVVNVLPTLNIKSFSIILEELRKIITIRSIIQDNWSMVRR